MDALPEEWSTTLRHRPPKTIVEVGCGTGYVITSAAGLAEEHGSWVRGDTSEAKMDENELRDHADSESTSFYATDLNSDALPCCASTWSNHGFGDLTSRYCFYGANKTQGFDAFACGDSFTAIFCDLLGPLESHLDGKVDLLLFNPPYVLTPSEEVERGGVAAAWAGGIDGREVTDQLLPKVFDVLAPGGTFMLILLEQNKPREVVAILEGYGLECEIVKSTSADEERLHVLRVRKPL